MVIGIGNIPRGWSCYYHLGSDQYYQILYHWLFHILAHESSDYHQNPGGDIILWGGHYSLLLSQAQV